MKMKVTVKCWQVEGWFLGRAKEIPGVLSQGKSLKELLENLGDAIRLMLADGDESGPDDIGVPSPPSNPPSLETSVELQLPRTWGMPEEGQE
jgi:predicted RNase H-like HicB family nuclease